MPRQSHCSVKSHYYKQDWHNYWSGTETYESLMMYIAMNYDGLRQLIVDMLGGGRCSIDVESFQNDITSFHSADLIIINKTGTILHMNFLYHPCHSFFIHGQSGFQ